MSWNTHVTCCCSCRQARASESKQAEKDATKRRLAEEGPQGNEDITQGIANSNINRQTVAGNRGSLSTYKQQN